MRKFVFLLLVLYGEFFSPVIISTDFSLTVGLIRVEFKIYECLCSVWLVYPCLMLVQMSRGKKYLYRLGTTELILPEEGDRIQSAKRCVFK
jgi:hypothetical protein